MSKPDGQSSSSDSWPTRDVDNHPANAEHNPHTRTIGSTLHHVFVLPMPANAGNTKSPTRKVSKRTANKGPGTIKRKSAIRAPKPKLTDEQKRELRRVRAAEERQRRKELGLCKDCKNLAIPGKTRCPDCAQKHNKRQR